MSKKSLHTEYPPRHFGRCAAVLQAINSIRKPTLADIAEETGLHENTIKNIRAKLLTEYGVDIVREGYRKCGYYVIRSWGVLDKKSVLKYEEILNVMKT